MNPDPAFLYPSRQHAAAMTLLEYARESQASFCLLTGEIGCGKTTVLRHFLNNVGKDVTVGLVSNTHARFLSIHPWALSALGIPLETDSPVARYEALTAFFASEYERGRRTLLVFDEAHNLKLSTLEELRLLSNVNSEMNLALQVLLVGQPELRTKLRKPELRQFAQRIAVDYHLSALSLEEVRAYIRHRLTVAGGDPDLFQGKAVDVIYAGARGIPRMINHLCDLALVYAYADGQHVVDTRVLALIIQDRRRGNATPPIVGADSPAVRLLSPSLMREVVNPEGS